MNLDSNQIDNRDAASESSAFLDDSDMEDENEENKMQAEEPPVDATEPVQNAEVAKASSNDIGDSLKNITDSQSSSSFSFSSNESRLNSPTMSPDHSKKSAKDRILPFITQSKTPEPQKSTSSQFLNSKGSQSIESTPKNTHFVEMSSLLGKRAPYGNDDVFQAENESKNS